MRQSTQTDAYFDIIRQRIADGGYTWCKQFGRLLRQDVSEADDPRLLDVGCQAGQLYQIIKDIPQIAYNGIDIEPQYLEVAKQIFPEIASKIWEASILDWPGLRPFEYATASAVLEHIEQSDKAFDNILKNMKRLALIRTFVQEEPQYDNFRIPGAPDAYLIKAFSFSQIADIAKRNACTVDYIEDEATGGEPYLIGESTEGRPIWRTMRIVKFSR